MENDSSVKNIIKSIAIIIAIIVIGILGASILASQKTPEQKLLGTWKVVSVSEGKTFERPKYDFVVTFEKDGVCSIKDSDPDEKYKEVSKYADEGYYSDEDGKMISGEEWKKMYPKQNKSGSYNCDITTDSISFSSKKDTYIYSYTLKNDVLTMKKDGITMKFSKQ